MFAIRHAVIFAVLGILATNFFWASNALLSTQVTQTIAPLHLNLWRWFFALVFLLPFGYRVFTRFAFIRANLWQLCLLSLLGVGTYNSLLYTASLGTSAINIALINTLIPISIVLCNALLCNKKPSLNQKLGIAIGFIGVFVILTRADIANLSGLQLHLSDGVMIVAVIVWGLYSVLLTRLRGTLPQIELLTLLVFVGWLWLIIFSLIGFGRIPIALLYQPNNLLVFIYLGIFPSILAYLFWNNGVAVLGPVVSGLSLYTQPVFGALLSWMILRQNLESYHLIAGVCIGGALLLCTYTASQQRHV